MNKNTTKDRNTSLDVIKGIAAIFVVFIHVQFAGVVGEYIAKIGSFAVPLFFMVSGYFSHQASKEKLLRSVKNTMILIIVAYAINILRIFVSQQCSFIQTLMYLKENIFTLKHIIMWLLLNTTYISGVAWFLWALLYCYVFSYVFYCLLKSPYVQLMIIFVGFLGGIMAQIGLPMLNQSTFSINNAWFCGLPYFFTGILVSRKYDNLSKHVKSMYYILAVIMGFALVTFSFIYQNGFGYIGNILLVVSLFVLCVKYPQIECKPLQMIGNQLAFFVYIMHPIFMHLYDAIGNKEDSLRPLVVLGVTIGFAVLFESLKKSSKSKL